MESSALEDQGKAGESGSSCSAGDQKARGEAEVLQGVSGGGKVEELVDISGAG